MVPVPTNPQAGSAEAGVFAIFNARSGAWEPLPVGEEARVQPGDAYVGPDGTVRVQVSAAPDRMVRFLPPAVTIEGIVS